MKIQDKLWIIGAGLLLLGGQAVLAQTREMSVSYLRAALGSVQDRTKMTLEAIYSPDPGMVEATRFYLHNKGYSRFSVQDSRSAGAFTSMYCSQENKAFKDLVAIQRPSKVRLSGYKDYGEDNESAFFVTGVEVFEVPTKPTVVSQEKEEGTFRVTINNAAAGTKTVLANVSPGKSYTVEGTTLMIEHENVQEAQEVAPPVATPSTLKSQPY